MWSQFRRLTDEFWGSEVDSVASSMGSSELYLMAARWCHSEMETWSFWPMYESKRPKK